MLSWGRSWPVVCVVTLCSGPYCRLQLAGSLCAHTLPSAPHMVTFTSCTCSVLVGTCAFLHEFVHPHLKQCQSALRLPVPAVFSPAWPSQTYSCLHGQVRQKVLQGAAQWQIRSVSALVCHLVFSYSLSCVLWKSQQMGCLPAQATPCAKCIGCAPALDCWLDTSSTNACFQCLRCFVPWFMSRLMHCKWAISCWLVRNVATLRTYCTASPCLS